MLLPPLNCNLYISPNPSRTERFHRWTAADGALDASDGVDGGADADQLVEGSVGEHGLALHPLPFAVVRFKVQFRINLCKNSMVEI